MNETSFRVLDQYREGSVYSDEVGKQYHFPKKHLKLLSNPDTWFLYHEPQTKGAGEFFGCGKIGEITPDKENSEKFFAVILDYKAFLCPVPDTAESGKLLEIAPYFNAQNAVRRVEPSLFETICAKGGVKPFPLGGKVMSTLTQNKLKIVGHGSFARRFWSFSAGSGGELWEQFYDKGIAAIGWDGTPDLREFTSKEALRKKLQELWPGHSSKRNDALACWQFVHEMSINDIIFVKQGITNLIGYGVVEGDYEFDATRTKFRHIRKVRWLGKGNWSLPKDNKMALKTLTDITSFDSFIGLIAKKIGLDLEGNIGQLPKVTSDHPYPKVLPATNIEPYDKTKAMTGLFLAGSVFDGMLTALEEKKNVILQGAPGVGKTFIAKRLAYAMIGSTDPHRIEMIQFHQSYSYEDFIQGFRPTEKGDFDLKNGIFYQFCERAQKEEAEGNPFVLIIDEINRGNLSKIFGELMMLIEPDKRGQEYSISLAYSRNSDDKFYIPKNLHIIGTMNTADRSLAMVDFALRRRFRFIRLQPEYSSLAFVNYLMQVGTSIELAKKIVARMESLNEAIEADSKNLGIGYQIGHSFFCPRPGVTPDDAWYERIVESEIVPLLEEYWFDNDPKVKKHRLALLA